MSVSTMLGGMAFRPESRSTTMATARAAAAEHAHGGVGDTGSPQPPSRRSVSDFAAPVWFVAVGWRGRGVGDEVVFGGELFDGRRMDGGLTIGGCIVLLGHATASFISHCACFHRQSELCGTGPSWVRASSLHSTQ